MADRVCVECGSTKRMVGRPQGSDLCTVCSGQQRHPYDEVKQASSGTVSRFVVMKGIYDEIPGRR